MIECNRQTVAAATTKLLGKKRKAENLSLRKFFTDARKTAKVSAQKRKHAHTQAMTNYVSGSSRCALIAQPTLPSLFINIVVVVAAHVSF